MRSTATVLLSLATLGFPSLSLADVALPAVFSDHMVLQRDMPIRIFGQAQANEAITVALQDAKGAAVRTARATAGADGRFTVSLEQLAASSAPMQLVVSGANTVTVNDVLVGEVWVAGGQSNMEWNIGATGQQAVDARAAAGDGAVRLLKAPHVTANRPQTTIQASWTVLAPDTVNDFSAIAFWFAHDLRESLGVPVGILSINWGGTRAEPWVDLATLGSHARYETIVAAQRAAVEEWSSTPAALRDRAWRETWSTFQKLGGAWWSTVNSGDPGNAGRWFAADVAAEASTTSDDGWRAAKLPQKWSADEWLRSWDGVVWYRRTVDIPADWAGKDCMVELGPIDDCDVVFYDGHAVGNTISEWSAGRRYRVPGAMVKAGPAVLAIEVLDLHGEGGVTGGAMRVVCPQASDAAVAIDGDWLARKGRSAEGIPPPPERPSRQVGPALNATDPAALYHAMIAPFAGYAVRGAIWYQGESNAGSTEEAAAYADLLPLVVRSWRSAFERPDMPFGVVSLAAFHEFEPDHPQAGVWPTLRNSQLAAEAAVPNLGVVTTIDVGDAGDIHPRDKRTVGHRLAAWARSNAYGQTGTAWRGPRVSRSRVDADAVVLEFDVERPPLTARGGGDLQGFALAGADGVFHWAKAAAVSPTTVRLTCPEVPKPIEVRYAWQDNPRNANLVDGGGGDSLPAHPFRRVVGN